MDPIPQDDDIDQFGNEHTRFLYPAFQILASCEDGMTGSCDLKDDYKDRWNKVRRWHREAACSR